MPTLDPNFIIVPDQAADISISLEPADNALHSLMLLSRAHKYSGLGEWIEMMVNTMSATEQETHRLVIEGLHYALVPTRSWPSFTAYVDNLANKDPFEMRDRLLNSYLRMAPCDDAGDVGTPINSASELLQSPSTYIRFLRQRFGDDRVDETIEAQAYTYVLNPPAMQLLIVSHLRSIWETYLQAEWQRALPMLTESVRAFSSSNLSEMERIEAVEYVTGRPFTDEHLIKPLNQANRIIFVPSPHMGPYLGKFWHADALGLVFGVRSPEGTARHTANLGRAEAVVRLNALADNTRLQILQLIRDEGEQRSQDIMRELELSQSAASRHLQQLSANGYLNERRCDGAKCYSLNPQRIRDTLDAVGRFLT